MRALPWLALGLLAGCTSPLDASTPVVVVVHEVAWTPEPGAGRASADFGTACEMARYARDPPAVELFGEPPLARPDFLVLHDFGDAWRATVEDGGAGRHSILAASSHSGGDAIAPWVGGNPAGESSTTLGTPGPFPREMPALPSASWRDGRAWWGDEALDEGRPHVESHAYDVPTDLGPVLHVAHRLSVTYLGKVDVELHAIDVDCRTPSLLVGP